MPRCNALPAKSLLGLIVYLAATGTLVLAQPSSGPVLTEEIPAPPSFAAEGPLWEGPAAVVASPPPAAMVPARRPAPGGLWATGEYLYWWTSGMDLPPLVTTSLTGTPPSRAGVLGDPATSVLIGDTTVHDGGQSGGRFAVGTWLDAAHCRGLEVGYLFLDEQSEAFAASGSAFPILARPFFNVLNEARDARRVAFPGEITGDVAVGTTTQLQAFEALYRVSVPRCAPCRQLTYVLGYRFVELEDGLRVDETTRVLSGPLAGTRFALVDGFDTRNTFHGGEIGVIWAHNRAAGWSWEAGAKVALGSAQTRVAVDGRTVTTSSAGGTSTTHVGLLAQGTNIGSKEERKFAAIPEFHVRLRRQWITGLTTSLGYTLLFWGEVARAGDQVDLGVNPSQIPPGTLDGPSRPALALRTTDFTAQGLSFGIEYVY